MKKTWIFGLVAIALIGLWVLLRGGQAEAPTNDDKTNSEKVSVEVDPQVAAEIQAKREIIRIDSPKPNSNITDPLVISGQARGNWFFEGTFPVLLTDWDGRIIAEGYATAEGDWMTEEFVSYTASLDFESPYAAGDPDFMRRGALILRKDNPSGLPENDDALELPVIFAAPPDVAEPVLRGAMIEVYDGISFPSDSIELDLSGRSLTGSLKAEVRQLTALEVLDISGNDFTGLPAEVGQLSNLRVLDLSGNPLTGLPHELGNLTKLEMLDLRGTQYSEYDLGVIRERLPSSTGILVD